MEKTMLVLCAAALAVTWGVSGEEMKNLALGAKATASSWESAGLVPGNAADGKGNTRWASKRTDNEWLLLDLGTPKTVGMIRLDWEAAAGKNYVVQFSMDGKNFTDVHTVTDGKRGAREIFQVKPQETRYIRILGRKRASQFGYSLWEVMVYPPTGNLALGAKATASSKQGSMAAANAVDGNLKTRWGSARTDDEWIQLDLGSEKTVGKLILKWEQAAGKEYTIQFSDDGKPFTEVFRKTDGKPNASETIQISPRKTRYIRIQGIKRATTYGYSLWEVEAYEKQELIPK